MDPNTGRLILGILLGLTITYLIYDSLTGNTGLAIFDGILAIVLFKLRASIPKW